MLLSRRDDPDTQSDLGWEPLTDDCDGERQRRELASLVERVHSAVVIAGLAEAICHGIASDPRRQCLTRGPSRFRRWRVHEVDVDSVAQIVVGKCRRQLITPPGRRLRLRKRIPVSPCGSPSLLTASSNAMRSFVCAVTQLCRLGSRGGDELGVGVSMSQ